MKPLATLEKEEVMKPWMGRVFLVLCVTAMGCATGSHRESVNDAISHVKQGRALQEKGDFDGAIAEYRTALRLDPNQVVAHMNLGAGLATKGDWDGAIGEYRKALRLDPKNAAVHYDLGAALRSRGKKSDAKQEFVEVLRLLPDTQANQNNIRVVKQHLRELE